MAVQMKQERQNVDIKNVNVDIVECIFGGFNRLSSSFVCV